MFAFEARRARQCGDAAAIGVRRFDIAVLEPKRGQQVGASGCDGLRDAQDVAAEIRADNGGVDNGTNVESVARGSFNGGEGRIIEPLPL